MSAMFSVHVHHAVFQSFFATYLFEYTGLERSLNSRDRALTHSINFVAGTTSFKLVYAKLFKSSS